MVTKKKPTPAIAPPSKEWVTVQGGILRADRIDALIASQPHFGETQPVRRSTKVTAFCGGVGFTTEHHSVDEAVSDIWGSPASAPKPAPLKTHSQDPS